jgi:hypothetical protein
MRARALLAIFAATLVAGCGSDGGHGDYVKALNAAQTELAQRFTALQAHVTPTSSAQQDRRTLLAYERAVGTVVRDLRAVDAPAGFAVLHHQLIAQVADYGSVLRNARSQLDGNDPKAVLAVQGELRTAVAEKGRRLNTIIQAINRKLKG